MIIIIIIFLHGLGRLTCSGIDALPFDLITYILLIQILATSFGLGRPSSGQNIYKT
jgi:hypothetical protein